MKKIRNEIDAKFLRHWAKKRNQKTEYIIKQTLFQSILFSLFMVFVEYKDKTNFFDFKVLKSFLILFLISIVLWGSSSLWQFNLTEKRYQKLLKEHAENTES